MSRSAKVLLGVCLALGVGGQLAWAIDPMDAQSLQVRKFFINESGAALTSGTAVVLSFTDSDLVTGASKNATSNLGMHVTTTTVADDRTFVGIIHQDSCASASICEVTVYGPELARFACSSDNTAAVGAGVGTATTAGLLGSGTRAGLTLGPAVSSNNVSDNCLRWIYVNPSNSS